MPEVWDAARRADARPREHHNFVAAPHLQNLHQVRHKPLLNTCTVQQSKETEGAHKISKLVYLSLQLFLCVKQLWCAQLTAEVLVVG